MKKGIAEDLSFFIGILITALILAAVILVPYKIYSEEARGGESLTKLAEAIKKAEENKEQKFMFAFSKNTILVGFGNDKEYAGEEKGGTDITYCNEWLVSEDKKTFRVEKPEKCNSGCLCLCKIEDKEYEKELDMTSGIPITYYYAKPDICKTKETKCVNIGDYEITGGHGKACYDIAFIPWNTGEEPNVISFKKKGKVISIDDEKAR